MDPRLQPFLEKYGVQYEMFVKKGRAISNIVDVRSAIITEMHLTGMSWADMIAITGLSNGTIQRHSKGKRNPIVKKKISDNMARMCASRKGEVKPWFSDLLRKLWKDGHFDFHKGRIRPSWECAKLRASLTDARRKHLSHVRTYLWKTPSYRDSLLQYHRSEEQRRYRSMAQSKRLVENPSLYHRGMGCFMDVSKCSNGSRIWVRSQAEKRAVLKLELDDNVVQYQYEYRFEHEDRWFIPDFIVHYTDQISMVEVKPAWVVRQGIQARKLQIYEAHATANGWGFEIWTQI